MMRVFKSALAVFVLATALVACGPRGEPHATPTFAASEAVQQPVAQSGGMSPLTAGLLGAAAGYMLGNSNSNTNGRSEWRQRRDAQRQVVIVQQPAPRVRPTPSYSTAPKSYSYSRPSTSFSSSSRGSGRR